MRNALLALAVLASGLAADAHADELRILSAAAVKGPASEVAERFSRDTGHRVVFDFMTSGQLDEKLTAGARPDIVINVKGRIAARSGASPTGMALVRDLGTVKVRCPRRCI